MKKLIIFLILFFMPNDVFSAEVVRKMRHAAISNVYQIEFTFYKGEKQVARQETDFKGNFITEEGKIPDGVVKEYYKDGNLKAELNYNNNRLHGPAKFYFKNGTLMSESNWHDGVLHGPRKTYYASGYLKEKGDFDQSRRVWLFQTFYENGRVHSRTNYHYGDIVDIHVYFPDGKVKSYIRNETVRHYDEYRCPAGDVCQIGSYGLGDTAVFTASVTDNFVPGQFDLEEQPYLRLRLDDKREIEVIYNCHSLMPEFNAQSFTLREGDKVEIRGDFVDAGKINACGNREFFVKSLASDKQ